MPSDICKYLINSFNLMIINTHLGNRYQKLEPIFLIDSDQKKSAIGYGALYGGSVRQKANNQLREEWAHWRLESYSTCQFFIEKTDKNTQ